MVAVVAGVVSLDFPRSQMLQDVRLMLQKRQVGFNINLAG